MHAIPRHALIALTLIGLLALLSITPFDPGAASAASAFRKASADAFSGRSHVIWFGRPQTQLEYGSPTYYVLSGTAVGDVLNAQVGVEGEAVGVVALSRVAIDEDTGEALLAAGEPTEESLARLAAFSSPSQSGTADTGSLLHSGWTLSA